jgi:hypothetical protein
LCSEPPAQAEAWAEAARKLTVNALVVLEVFCLFNVRYLACRR